MPASYEAVPNKSISGDEAAQIILSDVKYVLERDGVLTEHIAFPELSYKITVEIQMNNSTYPKHVMFVQSRPKPGQHEAVKPFPLPQVIVGEGEEAQEQIAGIALERTRKVTNPNKERIKRGMGITVVAPDPKTGHLAERKVKYDESTLSPEDLDLNEGAVDKNVTEAKRKEWGWEK
jgi:hypothetical protein